MLPVYSFTYIILHIGVKKQKKYAPKYIDYEYVIMTVFPKVKPCVTSRDVTVFVTNVIILYLCTWLLSSNFSDICIIIITYMKYVFIVYSPRSSFCLHFASFCDLTLGMSLIRYKIIYRSLGV